jgi:LPS-assembly lipoprotein
MRAPSTFQRLTARAAVVALPTRRVGGALTGVASPARARVASLADLIVSRLLTRLASLADLFVSRLLTRLASFAALVVLSLAAGGCGFHLEGSTALPPGLGKTYLDSTDPHSEFHTRLTDALRLRGSQVVETAAEADSVLKIVGDSTGQRVLSVSARNIPREYEIYYQVTFSLTIGGDEIIEPESLVMTRSYTYDETQVLAKSREELDLRRSLAEDLARQVLRRIEAMGATTAPPRT